MQSPAVLVTSRRVQNVHTGLDLTVPRHQEVRGRMMSGHVEYQILVVTRLAAFKSAKHRPEDVVQFLVSKKYSEIEDLYQTLSSRHPAASLPPLPRKALFVGESDIRERTASFNEILRCISKDAELAGSPELLAFLGTRGPGAVDPPSGECCVLGADSQAGPGGEAVDFFEQQGGVVGVGPQVPGLESEAAGKSLGEEEEEEEVLDPLGILRSRKPKKRPEVAAKSRALPRLTIFDEEVNPDEALFGPSRRFSPQGPAEDAAPRDPLKLFDDPDLSGAVPLGDPLLLPATRGSGRPTSSLGLQDASEELFSVEEDLDHILNLGVEPTPKPKPPVAAKPPLPRNPAGAPTTDPPEAAAGQRKQQQIQAMDEMDILQYIRDHDTPGQAAPSLF